MTAEALLAELGPDLVTPGEAVPARNRHDWAGLPPVQPLALVRPRTTADVSRALALCHAARLPVVPQGGLTGISGGAQPTPGAVVLSLERMTRVLEVDAEAATLTAEAGATLQDAQQAAAGRDLLLAVDLGARGSCSIGGVIATNAGGTQVIRYGMAREHVLGLEAVLADGTVLASMNTMLKNNAGLDLKQLFIGTEGLLGVVTRAVLRLHPRPTASATAFCGCPDSAAVLGLLGRMRRELGPGLTAFEVMWPSFYDLMAQGIGAAHPLGARHGAYVIVEAAGFGAPVRERLEAALAAAMEDGTVADAVLAASTREERALWAVREGVAEYGRILGPLIAFDVGIPLHRMAEAVAGLEAGIAERWPGARALCYGHLGDGNLHLVVNVPGEAPQPEGPVKAFVYGIVRALGGTVSAEHGIGLIKRDYLGYSRTEAEIAAMRAVKAALDPHGILNPGKSFA